MTYAIVKVTNGNYNIDSEGYTNISSAKVQFHNLCSALWNDHGLCDDYRRKSERGRWLP